MMMDLLLVIIIVSLMMLALGFDLAMLVSWICNRWRGRGYGTRHYK